MMCAVVGAIILLAVPWSLGQKYWLGLFNKLSHYKRSQTGGHGFMMFSPSLDHFHNMLSKRSHGLSFYLACQILFAVVSDFFVLEKDKIQAVIIYYFVLLIYCRFGDYLIFVVRCQCYAAKSLHNLFLTFITDNTAQRIIINRWWLPILVAS